jgi:hypothetical protein
MSYLRGRFFACAGLPVAARSAASAFMRWIFLRVRRWFICIFSKPVRADFEDFALSALGLRAICSPIRRSYSRILVVEKKEK